MKILISVFTYWPDRNGVQNVTQYQAEGLAARGHEVTVLRGVRSWSESRREPVLRDCGEHNGVHIVEFPGFTDFMVHFGNKKAYQAILREWAERVDVIMAVCPQSWCADWLTPIVWTLPCACTLMVHGIHDTRWSTFHDHSLYGLARKIEGDLRWPPHFRQQWPNYRAYAAIMQLHEQDRAYLYFQEHGVTRQHVLYNAVDDRIFVPSKKKKQVLNIGTFAFQKRQMLCLDAFYQSKLKDWSLMLIGSPDSAYYHQVCRHHEELERRYGHRDVQILCQISRDETIEHIRESSIYLLTSITEMFPVSLIEGMASGCAFVSTDVGIDRYLPGGVIGNDVTELAHGLDLLADDTVREQYAQAGQAFASKNCRRSTAVQHLEQILQDAVAAWREGKCNG